MPPVGLVENYARTLGETWAFRPSPSQREAYAPPSINNQNAIHIHVLMMGSGDDGLMPQSSISSVLDLPDGLLERVISSLDSQERKQASLACKRFNHVVQTSWRSIWCDIFSDMHVPSSLASFKNVHTLYWARSLDDVYHALEETPNNPDVEADRSEMFVFYALENVSKLRRLHALLLAAVTQPHLGDIGVLQCPGLVPESLQSAEDKLENYDITSTNISRDICTDALSNQEMTEGQQQSLVDGRAQTLSDAHPKESFSEPRSAPLEAPSSCDPSRASNKVEYDVYKFCPLHLHICYPSISSCESLMQLLQLILPENLPYLSDVEVGCADTAMNAKNLPSSSWHGNESADTQARALQRRSTADEGNEREYPMFPLFESICTQWIALDGHLSNLILSAKYSWDDVSILEKTVGRYGRLESLTLTTEMRTLMEEDASLSQSFNDCLSESLCEKLPALKELCIGRPHDMYYNYLYIESRALNMKNLTRLVLNDRVSFSSFSIFTNLTSLRSLSCAMRPWSEDDEHNPQDLKQLSSLKSLEELSIDHWLVQSPVKDAITSLKHLTDLNLFNLRGHLDFIESLKEMPTLLAVTLTSACQGQNLRFDESFFGRTALKRISYLFPSAEVIQIGTIGCGPSCVWDQKDMVHLARIIDQHVIEVLQHNNQTALWYLQVNAVIDIRSIELENRCLSGSVEMENTLEIVGSLNNNDAMLSLKRHSDEEELDTPVTLNADREGARFEVATDVQVTSKSEKRWYGDCAEKGNPRKSIWTRSVEFVEDDVTIAEFHYIRNER